ncbi:MAG: peptidylprolyl isomerase [Ferruginibacter sp.]|nr:peptidylprolyl isomerase [Ferruginibacter sp.]
MKHLKFTTTLVAFLLITSTLFSQTLFTYGGIAVSKEEFLKAYNKNKTTVVDKQASINEYLDLYTKFKLKVKAAKDLGIDTLPQLKYDLESFKTQVEESYMSDDKSVDELTNEAFERNQKDVHVYHFFVPFTQGMPAADTVKAYNALNEVRNQLTKNNTDYTNIATNASKVFTVKHSDIGFITAFTLPYEYETVIYKLQVGQFSSIYRSKKGIHIFKNIEERKSVGTWRIAQILFAFAPDENANNTPYLKAKADSAYALLLKGGDFASLAKKLSDDKMSYNAGGELPMFTTGKFQPVFEKEVFKLKANGDISNVFTTPFGYHIVKRLEQMPTPSSKDSTGFMFELKQKVQQDARINIAREKFAQSILAKLNYKKLTGAKDADLYKYADSISKNPSAIVAKYPISKANIFNLHKKNYTGADWLAFIKDYKTNGELYQGEDNEALYKKFVYTTALAHYRKNLEQYNNDFKYQMAEFKEGNMLFEIMERKVWSKAANDMPGLQKHYETNKAKYKWAASAAVVLFNCSNEVSAKKAITDLKAGKNWKLVTEEANNAIQADSGRYELTQIPIKEGTNLQEGMISDYITNGIDGSASFVKIIKLYPANEQRSFTEAKGLIINDYQTTVEEKWIEELKKKYPVKVNEVVLKELMK